MSVAIKYFRFLFVLNVAVAILWLVTYTIIKISGVEFIKLSHEDFFMAWGIVSTCLLPITFQLKRIKARESWHIIAGKVIVGSLLTLIFLFIAGAASLSNMCNWTTRKVIYTNLIDPRIQIAERDFGCGATDSSPAVKKNFRIKKVLSIFMKADQVELSSLKKGEWISH